MEIFFNPWIVGTGTTVVAGLILYYFFGVGKVTNKNRIDPEQTDTRETSRQKEYEMEMESFRNDMVRRGLAHTNIRINGEAGLRTKYGIKAPANVNEIELVVGGTIYRLTNQNNNNKYDRAKTDAGLNASPEQILAHYDKLAGYIKDSNGNKINNGPFWEKEKSKLESRQKQVTMWGWVAEITSHPVIATLTIILISAFIWYVFGFDLSRFR